MKAVIQRVYGAKLSVDGEVKAEVGRGLVVYVGVEQADGTSHADTLAQKVTLMRIFEDDAGKMNLSVSDLKGDILLVSNFTLCADIKNGHRPSFSGAKRPASDAKELFDYCVEAFRGCMDKIGCGGNVKCGVFGADMKIDQVNDGPVTIIY